MSYFRLNVKKFAVSLFVLIRRMVVSDRVTELVSIIQFFFKELELMTTYFYMSWCY